MVAQDLFRWFEAAAGAEPRVDLVFLDPPYRFLREKPDALLRLAEKLFARHVAPAGTVVFRHDAGDRLEMPALERYDQRDYGGMAIELLRPHR